MVDRFIQPDHPANLARRLAVLSVSHVNAAADVRARAALDEDHTARFYRDLQRELAATDTAADRDAPEVLVLSTCNRTELYLAGTDLDSLVTAARSVWERMRYLHPVDLDAVREFRGQPALRHLCRVACGLESVVVGETQIVQQLREALSQGVEAGRIGEWLHTVAHVAFRVSRRVRALTRISDGRVSTASVAVEFVRRTFGELRGRTAVVIGAGRIARLTVDHLVAGGIGEVRIVNRTRARADELARRAGLAGVAATSSDLHELGDAMAGADAVISAVAGTPDGWLLAADQMATTSPRDDRPVVLVDLGMPATIDPAIARRPGHIHIGIDDLDHRETSGRLRRLQEVPAAEAIVEQELAALVDRDGAVSKGVMRSLFRRFSDVTRCEVARQADSGLPQTTEDLERFAARLVRKLMAPVASHCRSDEVQADTLATLVALFKLQPDAVIAEPDDAPRPQVV